MSEWPSHCCTVRRSTPAHRHRVANVARNLWSQKFSGSSFARSATAFRLSRKLSFGLHPEVGNSRLHFLFALAFHAFRFFTSLVGIGISRSLYAFGVQPQSGLWVTRTIDPTRLMSRHSVYITSCSRSPVIRKNSYQSRSSVLHAAKSLSSSSCS